MTVEPRRTRLKRDVKDSDRVEVLARAECRYCGDLMGPFEVDHVTPLSRGGTNDLGNLACTCVSCNTQKGYHLLHEWIRWRKANGMSWPPVAQHATDPQHYPDHCSACRKLAAAETGETSFNSPKAYDLQFTGNGYKAYYRCDRGHAWTCSWALGTWYYSDCECNYCVASRLEADA